MTTNHSGTTVRFLYPIPKGRNEPSGLYNITGFIKFTRVNNSTKSPMATVKRFI